MENQIRLTAEYRKRIIEAKKETQGKLNKELAISKDLQNHRMVQFYTDHIQRLEKALETGYIIFNENQTKKQAMNTAKKRAEKSVREFTELKIIINRGMYDNMFVHELENIIDELATKLWDNRDEHDTERDRRGNVRKIDYVNFITDEFKMSGLL